MSLSRLLTAGATLSMLILGINSSAHAADVQVMDAWARASAGPAKVGGAFLAIHNMGTPDRLISAMTSVADKAELHTHTMEAGVMKMRQVEAIDIDTHSVTELKPGGYHIMLMGLHAPLKQGESFQLQLTFEHGGTLDVPVQVLGVGAMGPETRHGQDHDQHEGHHTNATTSHHDDAAHSHSHQ